MIKGYCHRAALGCTVWLLGLSAGAAYNDNNIEADGIWHDEFDVSPAHPQRNEAFTLELRAFRFDLTGATVKLYAGTTNWYVPMSWNREEGGGTFDIWRATIGPIDSDFVYYHIQLFDGTAFATYAASGFWNGNPPGGDFLINLTPFGAYPLGTTVDGTSTVFRVWAPGAEQAEVILNPDATPSYVPMTSVQGFWQTRINGVGHGQTYKYRFFRNGSWLIRNDARAKWVPGSLAHSIVQRSEYAWEDQDWVIPDLEDSVIMEGHVGTFSGRGDGATNGFPATFRDLADLHVAHLAESGINVLQLMPLQDFRGEISWGYNPNFLFAPESAYGTPEDFKYLVNTCHKAGIAVWLDIVLNHFDEIDLPGNMGNYDGDDIYFYPPSSGVRDTGYGPRPDYGRVEVRQFLVDAMRFWMDEYHIDGFRLDHTSLIKINREGWLLLKEISRMRDRVNPRVIVTAEQWPNDSALTRPIIWGGAGLDAQWSDMFHDNGRAALNALAYGDPSMQTLADGLNHFGYSAREMIHFIESHDEARQSPQFAYEGRIVQVADQINPHSDFGLGRGKLFYGLIMYGAATPLILYGQEFATEIGYGDQVQNRIPWEHKQTYMTYFRACRDMTWLRRRCPALRADRWQNVFHFNDGANVLAWERAHAGHYAIIVANFSNNDWGGYWVGLPQGGTWYETINTASTNYGGSGTFQNGTFTAFNGPSGGMPYSAALQLPRYSMVVLTKHEYDLRPLRDADRDGIEDEWENNQGLNPNDAHDAIRDEENDDLTNIEEFLFDSDPWTTNSPPVLDIHMVGEEAELTFPTVPDRYYEVEACTNLHGSAWALVPPGTSTAGRVAAGVLTVRDGTPTTNQPSSFYRAKIRWDP